MSEPDDDSAHEGEPRFATQLAKALGQSRSGEVVAVREGLATLGRLVDQHPGLCASVIGEVCELLRKPYETTDLAARPARLAAQALLRQALTQIHWGLRKSEVLDLSGAVLIDFDLSGCKVADVDFMNTVFEGSTDFTKTRFHGEVCFVSCRFEGPTQFARTRFRDDADFAEVRFHGPVWFTQARFNQQSDFGRALFAGIARFDDAEFGEDAWFLDACFDADVHFPRARFGEVGYFDGTSFHAVEGLSSATVTGLLTFEQVTFHKGEPDGLPEA